MNETFKFRNNRDAKPDDEDFHNLGIPQLMNSDIKNRLDTRPENDQEAIN